MEPNRKHAAIDLETASLAYNAAVLTVGLVIFDPMADASTDLHYHWVVPHYLNKENAHVDLGTVRWWMQQGEAARSQAWLATPELSGVPFLNIIQMLDEVEHIWANDPDADCQWMKELYKRIGVDWKHYRKHRSIRTLRAMFDVPDFDVEAGVAHNALDDAKWNVLVVREVYSGRAIPQFGAYDPYRSFAERTLVLPPVGTERAVSSPAALGMGYGSVPAVAPDTPVEAAPMTPQNPPRPPGHKPYA